MTVESRRLRPAWRNYWPSWVLVIGLVVAAARSPLPDQFEVPISAWLAAAAFVLVVIAFKRFSWRFAIGGGRVTQRYGIIARNEQSVRLHDLRSVELDQGLVQRLLGIGDIAFYSAGSANAEVTFFGVPQPTDWRDRINDDVDRLLGSNE